MSGKKTLVFALIFVLIAGFYYFYEIQGGKSRFLKSEAEKELFHFKGDAVTGIRLKNPQGSFVLTQKNAQWEIKAPLSTAGDPQAISGLLRTLVDAQRGRTIAEKPKDLSPFGLNAPKEEVSFELKGKSKTAPRLLLGDENPTGTEVYAQLSGRPEVFLLGTQVKTTLDQGLYALRDKRLIPFSASAVTRILWQRGKLRLTTERTKDGKWELVEPFKAPADSQKIGDILFRLDTSQVKEFVSPEEKGRARFGLESPPLTLTLQADDKASVVLSFGNRLADGKEVYIGRQGEPAVLLVDSVVLKDIPETLADIRDRAVFKADQDKVLKVQWQEGKATPLVLVKKGSEGNEDWRVEKPVPMEADRSEAYGLLWDLHDTKLEKFVSDNPKNLAPYGLNSPQRVVTLWQQGEEKPQVLRIGKVSTKPKGFYATVSYSPSVFVLSQAEIKRLWRTRENLRVRRLLNFDTDKIAKVELRYRNTTVTLKKKGDRWEMLTPEKTDIAGGKMIDLLWGVRDLKFQRQVGDDVKNLSPFGLKNPQLLISLWTDSGKKLPDLTVGSKISGSNDYYLSREPFTSVYSVSFDLLNKLPKGPSDLLY